MIDASAARAFAAMLGASIALSIHAGDTLAVRVQDEWLDWWSADRAPVQWSAPLPLLSSAVQWHPGARGVEWGDAELSSNGEERRTRMIVVRRLGSARVHAP